MRTQLALALLPPLLFSACVTGAVCTEIGCQTYASFELPDLPDGTYRIEIDLEGQPIACDFALPEDAALGCEGLVEIWNGADGVTIAAYPEEPTELPASATVLLTDSEGTALIDEAVDLAWGDPVYPNGEACDELGCRSALVML